MCTRELLLISRKPLILLGSLKNRIHKNWPLVQICTSTGTYIYPAWYKFRPRVFLQEMLGALRGKGETDS